MSSEIDLINRKLEQERLARLEAERLLEEKSLELYRSNQELRRVNENQEQLILQRTSELRVSETNYQTLVESISDLICKTDLNGNIKYVNKVTSHSMQYTIDEIVGKNIFSFVAPAYEKKARSFVARQFRSKNCISYLEIPLVSKDGQIKWLGTNIQFLSSKCLECEQKYKHLTGIEKFKPNHDCIFEEIIIVARDINRQKKDEEISIAHNKQLEHLLDQQVIISNTALTLNSLEDFNTKIDKTLKIIGEHIGVSRVYIFENSSDLDSTSNTFEWCNSNISPQIDELQDIPYSYIPSWKKILMQDGIVHSENIFELPQDIVEILAPQEIKSIIVFPLTVAGSFFGFIGFDECVRFKKWEKSEIEMLRTTSNIISNAFERKRIETDLRKSENENRIIIEAIPDSIFIYNKNNQIKAHKPGGSRLQLSPDMNSLNPEIINTISKKYNTEIEIGLEECKSNGYFQFEFQYENNTDIRYFEARMFKLNDEDVISFVRDVSELKENEKQLKLAKENAENANKTKSEFLANVSHEIRTPMNAILGFSETLLDKIKEPQYVEQLKTILSSGRTLLSLINDILDLSKIEAGKLTIEPEPVNYYSIVRNIEQIFSTKIQNKQLSLEVINSPEIPEYLLLDQIRFHQILFNIVGNAIKFTEKGYIRLETKVLHTNNENKIDLLIEIEDTGIGIPEDQFSRIFEAFTQQNSQSNRKYEGTGLGLAISKRLIEKMNGSISISSKVGKGTTFTIHLKDILLAELRNNQTNYKDESENEIDFEPAIIMIVDDIDFNVKVVKSLLSFDELSFIEANSGEEAIELLEFEKPDIILMDIRMPGMSGISATEIIKNKHIQTPVIAFTASAMQEQLQNIEPLFDGYLRKPISKKILINTLKQHLRHRIVNKNVKTESIEDKQAEKVSEQCMKNNQQILKRLEDDFIPEWKNIAGNLVIFAIEEFCNKLTELGAEFECKIITDYALKLKNSLQTFDVELINSAIKEFENTLDKLNQISNA